MGQAKSANLDTEVAEITGYKEISREELKALVNDPLIAAEIEKAWKGSRPDARYGLEKMERGFWILRKNETSELSAVHYPTRGATHRSSFTGGLPIVDGETVIASFHTHPNIPWQQLAPANPRTGKYTVESFTPGGSDPDIAHYESYKRPLIIKSHKGYHFYGQDGR